MAARSRIYYPKSHVQNNLYTTGKEFMTEKGIEYIGWYHKYIDGAVMTRAEYDEKFSENLQKYKPSYTVAENLQYSLLKTRIEYVSPIYYYPKPTDEDYEAGFLDRYILKKRNSVNVLDFIEVDSNQFSLWEQSGSGIDENLYSGVQLTWKITGPLRDTTSVNGSVTYGIFDTNQRTVQVKDKNFTGLKNYLTNLTEFAKIA